MLRRLLAFICIWSVVLSGCAGGGGSSVPKRLAAPSTTGFTDPEDGSQFVSSDRRVLEERNLLAAQPDSKTTVQQPAPPASSSGPTAATPTAPTTAPPTHVPLRQRLREYQIERYHKQDTGLTHAARFGDGAMVISLFFSDAKPTEFRASLQVSGGRHVFTTRSGPYTLRGWLEDSIPYSTLGEFVLTQGAEEVRIYYRAWKAKLDLRLDRTREVAPGSRAAQLMNLIGPDTYGWNNNWTVRDGRTFFLLDIIQQVVVPEHSAPRPETPPTPDRPETIPQPQPQVTPIFTIKGDSKRTTERDQAATLLSNSDAPSVARESTAALAVNAEDSSKKIFAITVQDPTTQEKTEAMLDVTMEQPDPDLPIVDFSDTSDIKPIQPKPQTEILDVGAPRPRPKEMSDGAPTTPPPTPPARPQTPPAYSGGDAYLKIDTSAGPRTAQMTRDLEKNRNIPRVRQAIQAYLAELRSKHGLYNFYKYAHPFRHLISEIARSLDVSPAFAYLTVVESAYFTGGRYQHNQIGDGGKAFGPFQLHVPAATESGLLASESKTSSDERQYFATAACGAANYVGERVEDFMDGDTTMAIMAYNQGAGGARNVARMVVSQDRVKRFNYTYADLEDGGIPLRVRNYVNKKLAIYFISNNMAQYGVNVPSDAPQRLTDAMHVWPVRQAKGPKCRQIIERVRGR